MVHYGILVVGIPSSSFANGHVPFINWWATLTPLVDSFDSCLMETEINPGLYRKWNMK